jgi:myosin heavy subunit
VFTIVHYADKVPYTITEFVSKNRNTLNADVTRTMIMSEIPWLREVFSESGMCIFVLGGPVYSKRQLIF